MCNGHEMEAIESTLVHLFWNLYERKKYCKHTNNWVEKHWLMKCNRSYVQCTVIVTIKYKEIFFFHDMRSMFRNKWKGIGARESKIKIKIVGNAEKSTYFKSKYNFTSTAKISFCRIVGFSCFFLHIFVKICTNFGIFF